MPSMRRRLLATVALPFVAVGLAASPALASTLSSPSISTTVPVPGSLMLAQVDGEEQPATECPPGTTATAEGCVAAEESGEEEQIEEEPVEEAPAPEDVPIPDEPPAEEPPVEQAPEEPPAEQAPVEAVPVPEEAPTEDQAVDQPAEQPAGDAPVMDEAAPAEDPAAEELPEEEPADEQAQPAEEPAEAPAADDVPIPQAAPEQEAPVEENEEPAPLDDPGSPADDIPGEELPADDAPGENMPAEETPADDASPVIDDGEPLEEQPAPDGEVVPEGEALPQDSEAEAPQDEATPEPELFDVEDGAPILDSAKEEPFPEEAVEPDTVDPEVQAQEAEEMERLRERIERLEAERAAPPASDEDARAILREFAQPVDVQSITIEEGRRMQAAPQFVRPDNINIINQTDNRYVFEVDNRIIVHNSDRDRLARQAREVYYEELPRNRVREVVIRESGAQVITIRNRYGDVIQRSRIRPGGEEVILYYAPEYDRADRYVFRDPGRYLPPLQLTIPVERYIYDSRRADDYYDYVEFFEQPPIEPLVETYTIEEVKYSARVRDMMPRVDLDNITFEFGSATIGEDQIRAMEDIANAILDILERDESEIFLLEGHTDAVGSDQANLVLSDQRAESVAIALTNVFGIPPENLQTQGYGKRYLKVNTQEPERLNRRVAIRRITPLVQTAEAQQ